MYKVTVVLKSTKTHVVEELGGASPTRVFIGVSQVDVDANVLTVHVNEVRTCFPRENVSWYTIEPESKTI